MRTHTTDNATKFSRAWRTAAICTSISLLAFQGPAFAGHRDLSWDESPHERAREESAPLSASHGPNGSAGVTPLWGGATPNGRYSLPGNEDMAADQAFGNSHRCLTCHDGAMGRGVTPHNMSGGTIPIIGGQMGNDHPVGVAYSSDQKTRLRSRFSSVPGSSARVEDLLVNGRVECISCHAMYRDEAIPETALIRSEFGNTRTSCLVCHDM